MSKAKETKPADKSSVNDLYSQVKFLSDKPLTADYEQNDRFGHSGIAENLKQIVLTCPVPFTIGLFGKWGTGKTSILNILKDKLTAVHKIPVVTFDVWKHKGDALRRTFLKEVVEQLQYQGLLRRFKLSDRIDASISVTKKIEKIDKVTICVFISLVLLMVFIGLLFWNDKSILRQYYSIITSGSLVTVLLIWLFNRIIVTEDLTRSKDRFEDPHEFEKQFFDIIGKSKAQRLLISIDNLDRCTHTKAVELLSTIKTFLAKDSDTEKNNKCIFLITCDDGAIKKHIESVYSKDQKAFSSDEFLRKFFNAFIRLPDFIDRELQDYTEELLKQTGIPKFDDPDVGYVITTAFRDNPRQIKQFINILIAHFLMAHNRESGEKPLIVPIGTITNNIAFLAKFLIIQQNFPETYNKINREYLTRSEGRLLFNKVENDDFLRATKEIVVDDVRPFIYLKQSRDELAMPDIREIEEGLVDNNPELVKEKLTKIKEQPQNIILFNKFLLTLIRRNEKRPQILINIVNCTLDVLNKLKFELSKTFYHKLGYFLNDNDHLKNELYKFNPSLVFNEILTRCKEIDRDGLISKYVDYILLERNPDEGATIDPFKDKLLIGKKFAYDLLEVLVKNKSWLNNDEKAKIKGAIEEKYYNDIEVLSLFEDDVENQKDFISEEAISKFVSNFSEEDVDDIDSINEKITLLLKFIKIIKSEATESIIKKLDELLEAENKLPFAEGKDEVGRKRNLLNRIEDVLGAVVSEIKSESSKQNFNTFANKLNQGANAIPTWNERKIFVFSFLLVIDLIDDPSSKTTFEQFIQDFFLNADLASIQFVFGNKRLSRNKQTKLIGRYPSVFQQRAVSLQPVFNELYPIASKKNRIEWLVALIKSDHQRALQKLEDLGHSTDDNKKVVEALLERVSSITVQEKRAIYTAINKMKCGNNVDHRNTLVSQIKPLLKTTDPQNQKVGYHALEGASSFLSGSNKRDIATEVIEWLRNLEPANAGQVHSVESIYLVWTDLADTPRQGYYIDFISDKLIVRGSSLDSIKLGILILIKIKPTYENYSKQYDDIFARFETELDEDIKIVINGGLVNLKPEKTNKENKAFWDKIKKWDVDNDEE